MHYFRQTWLLAVLGLACGGKDETSATDGSDTGAASSTSSASDASATTQAPTTTGASSSGESSSGGSSESTAEPPACETAGPDCGVMVSETGSFCADPPPAKDELILEVVGPGSIKITEKGRTSACNITIGSEVFIGPNKSLIVNYVIMGQPERGCQCPQEVTSTVSGLSPGTWDVLVGSYEQKIDVP